MSRRQEEDAQALTYRTAPVIPKAHGDLPAPIFPFEEEVALQLLLCKWYRKAHARTVHFDRSTGVHTLWVDGFSENQVHLRSVIVRVAPLALMWSDATNIKYYGGAFGGELRMRALGKAWFGKVGAVAIDYRARWNTPMLLPSATETSLITTFRSFFIDLLHRVATGESSMVDSWPAVEDILEQIFGGTLNTTAAKNASKDLPGEGGKMNLYNYYGIESMVSTVILRQGVEEEKGEDKEGEDGGGVAGEGEGGSKNIEELLVPADADETVDETGRKLRDKLPLKDLHSEDPWRAPGPPSHALKVVDIGMLNITDEILSKCTWYSGGSRGVLTFCDRFLEDMQSYSRRKYDVLQRLVHGSTGATNVLVDRFSQAWLQDFTCTGIGPAVADLAQMECDLMFACTPLDDEEDLAVGVDILVLLSECKDLADYNFEPNFSRANLKFNFLWRALLVIRKKVSEYCTMDTSITQYQMALLAASLRRLGAKTPPVEKEDQKKGGLPYWQEKWSLISTIVYMGCLLQGCVKISPS
jgi:hypothetical protein